MGSSPAFPAWILGSLSSGVVAVDADGRVELLNAGAERILGAPPEAEARGRDCGDVLAGQPAVARLLRDALRGRRAVSRAELCLEAAGGRPGGTIGFTLSPVQDEDGALRGAAILFRDLTPIERMDEQERLRERLAALGQMAAGMAHAIRNPLAGMEVIAGLLRRRLVDRPEERELLERLTGELRAVAETVTSSLEFVRPEAPQHARVDLAELMEESLSLALARVPFAGRVECDVERRLPAVSAEAERLGPALTDVVVNALEAMADTEPAAAQLRVAVSLERGATRALRFAADGSAKGAGDEPSSEVVVSICDTGPGIAPEHRDKVFYPFFTTKDRGSGVGLANAQKVVASHGGSLELDVGERGGCVFRVRLPVTESPGGRA